MFDAPSTIRSLKERAVAPSHRRPDMSRFDIFKVEAGVPTWLECVETVKACKERLVGLQPQYPVMVVWDSVRGTKYSATEFLVINEREFSLSDLENPLYRTAMNGKERERWRALCEKAAQEKDGKKLLELVGEINKLLFLRGV